MKGVIGFISACALCAAIGCGGGGGGGGGTGPASTVNTLSSLELSNITLNPAFEADTTEYTAAAENSVHSITVTPTAASEFASITVNGTANASKKESEAINLAVGSNTVTVEVTSQSGAAKTYTITVTRDTPPLTEATSGSTTTITFSTGTALKVITTPTVAQVTAGVIPQFPTKTDDSVFANVPDPFIMAETDTTYQLWKEVYDWARNSARGTNIYTFANPGQNGSDAGGNALSTSVSTQYPVTKVNWRDAMVWCNALTEYYNANNGTGTDLDVVYYSEYDPSSSEYKKPIRTSTSSTTITETTAGSQDYPYVNASAKGFRLPTSMEYEFAARYIGTTTPTNTNVVLKDGVFYTTGASASGATAAYTNDAATLAVAVFVSYNSGTTTGVTGTAVVKSKAANALGLYDMSGNVWKWTFDWNTYRVLRGGSYGSNVGDTRAGLAVGQNPFSAYSDLGFRFARTY